MNEYEKQAMDFLKETGTEFKYRLYGEVNSFPFHQDTGKHYRYRVTLKRNGKKCSFYFYDSTHNYNHNIKTISAYDFLSCVQKSDCGTYNDFISEYGYNDFPYAKRIYNAVKKEYEKIYNMFYDCMDELSEIY